MAESVVKSAAMLLGNVAVEEVKYLGAVTGKVETLELELNTLAAFLVTVVKNRRQDTLVQTALTEARNLAYDCEDIIETYILKVARHGYEHYDDGGCQLGSVLRWACLLREAKSVHKIRSQVDDLSKRISDLKNSLVGYGITTQNPNQEPSELPPRRVYNHEREERVVVGLEKDIKELVGRLMDPTDKTIISICGMGGLGKSTLAAELYNHRDLRDGGYFQAFGWAAASQWLQPDQVLKNILYSLVSERDRVRRRKIEDDLRADRAHEALYDVMKYAKCLVIIDDIWTQGDWARLEAAFPRKNATGSRIILTTRNQDVLSSSSLDQKSQVYLHPLEGLDETSCWDLFQKTAFIGATSTDSTKEKLGREMLGHCKGVPLAIVVLGKVLKRKDRVEDWKQMRNDIYAQIGRGSSSSNPMEEVYDVLRVSYDELPYRLKQCFLQLANFPEDYELPTAKVCQLWVAEGIVLQENGNEMEEDVAERYLNELVSRNMVQAVSWVEGSNRIKTCRLHDLMRDVCIDIARREGFLHSIFCERSMVKTNTDHFLQNSLPQRDKRLRRLAVHIRDNQSSTVGVVDAGADNVSRAPNLRSLLLFSTNEGNEECNENVMKTIFEDYPLLRVFDSEEFSIIQGNLSEKVENLIHLRYLCLAKTCVSRLPSSIGKLGWLQTLDLRVNIDIVLSLPNVLWKMKQLRHLYLPFYGGLGITENNRIGSSRQRYLMKEGGELRLDGLSKLQTLVHVDLDTLDLSGLSQLERIRTLSAACETKRKTLYPFLKSASMKSITLRIHAEIMNEDPMILSSCDSMYELHIHVTLSTYTQFKLKQPFCLEMLPECLVILSVVYLQFVEDPLPILGLLPNLLNLNLHMCYGGSKMVCSANGFQRLTRLFLDGLFQFRHWEVEHGALQKLEYLTLVNCPVSRQKLPNALPSSVTVNIIGDDYQREDEDPKDGDSGTKEVGESSRGQNLVLEEVIGGEEAITGGLVVHDAPMDLANMEKMKFQGDGDKVTLPAEKEEISRGSATINKGIIDELKRMNDKFDLVLDYLLNKVDTEQPHSLP